MSGTITLAAVAAVGVGVGAYDASKQQGIENKALGIGETQLQMQEQSFGQLQQLIQNPGSFFSSPVYQAAFGQGTQATMRASESTGYTGSGNELTALQGYGQSFGESQLLSQEQLLAGMSGTGFNPASATQVASGANNTSFNQLGTLLAALGQSGSMFNGGGGGGGSVTPGAAGVGNFDGSMLGSETGNAAFSDPALAGGFG